MSCVSICAFALVGLNNMAMALLSGVISRSSPSRFEEHHAGEHRHAGHVAARTIEALDKAEPHRIGSGLKHDRDRRRRGLRHLGWYETGVGEDYVDLAADQIARQRRQTVVLAFRPAVFDRDVLTLDESGFTQAIAKRG